MHEYSIDRHPKVKIIFWIALIAVTATPFISKWINAAATWANAGTYSLSSGAIFFGIYYVFDKWGWRMAWIRRCLLVPDLNGTWSCAGATLHQGVEKMDRKWNATVNIVQSWSRIVIRLKTDSSESRSTSASVIHEDGNGFRLRFSYVNTPKVGVDELNVHAGFCELVFNKDITQGEGEYFTNHHRLTYGSMSLTRKAG